MKNFLNYFIIIFFNLLYIDYSSFNVFYFLCFAKYDVKYFVQNYNNK